MRGEIESALKEEEDNPRIQSVLDGLLAETQRLCDVVGKLLGRSTKPAFQRVSNSWDFKRASTLL
jgi:hypothetical protein